MSTVLETERARHAVNLVRGLSHQQLSVIDGIVAVGGDGLFHEVINGLLGLREGGDERAVPAAFLRIGATFWLLWLLTHGCVSLFDQ